MDLTIGNQFIISHEIAKGHSSCIFQGRNLATNEEVAIKLEKASTSLLRNEWKVYKSLQGVQGIAKVYFYSLESLKDSETGEETDYNILVLELLGPSLEDLFNYCNQKLTLKTVLMILYQIITRIESIHSKNLIHRDIKPNNFLIGRTRKSGTIHLIDFGLSTPYKNSKNIHIPYTEGNPLISKARYASINSHFGIQQSRRDDLESIFYMCIYFLNHPLPWQQIQQTTKQDRLQKILERKVNTPVLYLCKSLPEEFCTLVNYSRSLRFEQTPNYSYIKSIINEIISKEGISHNCIYDWVLLSTVSIYID